jgi:uncharacterized protein (TIGR02271 family)
VVNTGDRDNDASSTGDATQPAIEKTQDDSTLRLLAEEVRVAKETVETGRVRVARRTREREALIDEILASEHVEIETIPIGRRIDAVPAVRQEGDTTIVPVVEEILVVERRLMLREEIHVTRVRTTSRHQETVVLRHQEAVVTRDEDELPGVDRPIAEAKPTAVEPRRVRR